MKLLAIISLSITLLLSGNSFAEELTKKKAQGIITPFYDLFSLKGSAELARPNYHPNYQSFYSRDGSRDLTQTLHFVATLFPKMVPDTKWEQDDLLVSGNQVIVRGTLTGTPVGDTFFGVPVTGKSFSIMTIDIHTIQDGKIITSYHVEDWAAAFAQMADSQ